MLTNALPMLRVSDVTRQFQAQGRTVRALAGVSLSVPRGSTFSLVDLAIRFGLRLIIGANLARSSNGVAVIAGDLPSDDACRPAGRDVP